MNNVLCFFFEYYWLIENEIPVSFQDTGEIYMAVFYIVHRTSFCFSKFKKLKRKKKKEKKRQISNKYTIFNVVMCLTERGGSPTFSPIVPNK